ncbi:hypothetical protein [Alicyclobacillus sp. ALC3]|uniref:hypothetical protein n=1 Tax=Alicyclobacillus sp. ALC3 TaxID=2796143 RepID=UPI002379FFA5|nr:hypothetical protein [Alicyclobacillus sp. ALC3]WDL96960.1 hypothetical protein JC200_22220 [Alicyclobacillus sp. ALC3]
MREEIDEHTEVIEMPEPKHADATPILIGALAFFLLAGSGLVLHNEVQAQATRLHEQAVTIRAQSDTIRALQATERNDRNAIAKLQSGMTREQHNPNF